MYRDASTGLWPLAPGLIWLLMVSAGVAQPPAEAKARVWRAAVGGYQVEAVLLDRTPTTVRLQKADSRIVTVPIAKLSKADQDYLKTLPADDQDPFAGGAPAPLTMRPGSPTAEPAGAPAGQPGEPFELSDEGREIAFGQAPAAALEPDPMPRLLKLQPGSVQIREVDAYDKPSELCVVDPSQSLVAISISRNVAGRPLETAGALFVGQLPNGPFREIIRAKETMHILDHHPGTGQSLVVTKSDQFQRGGEIQIWDGLATGAPQARFRGLMPGHDKPGFKPKAEQAWLLAKDIAIVQVNDALYCWDFAKNQLLYRTARNTVNSLRRPSFSGGRRYFALPVADGFQLVDSASGKDLGFVQADTISSGGVAFHPDGKRVAIASSNAWGVYDCQAAKMTQSGTVAAHLHNRLTGWVNDHCFLTDNGSVLDVNAAMVVWNYYASPSASKYLSDGALSVVSTHRQQLRVDTLPMLDPQAKQAIQQLPQRGELMITQPGTEVRVVISAEDAEIEPLQTALEESIARAGWKVNPNAPLAIIATIGRGKPYDLKYRQGARLGGQVHTVNIHPFTATLEIRDAKQVLWRRETENHVPRLLFLRGGETVQQAVKRYERPQPSFFSSMRIPTRIPKPEIAKGLGRSRLDKGKWVDFPFR